MEVAVVADLGRVDALRQARTNLRERLVPAPEQGLGAGKAGATQTTNSCREVVERPCGAQLQRAGPGGNVLRADWFGREIGNVRTAGKRVVQLGGAAPDL